MKKAFFILTLITLCAAVAVAQPAPAPKASPSTSIKPATSGGGKAEISLPAEKAQPHKMPKFDKAPVVDGTLDDETWQSANILRDLYATPPRDKVAAAKP